MTSLLRLLVRGHAAWVGVWVAVVAVLVVVTLPAYVSTYADAATRATAVAQAQQEVATTLLYGTLPDPGSPAQMFSWEVGTFITLLVSTMGVLLAVRLTRAAEQDGTVELVRAAGLGRSGPLVAGLVVISAVAALLAVVVGAGLGLRAGRVEGVDVSGVCAFALVVAATFTLVALLTIVVAQVVPTPWSARVAGMMALACCFAMRAAADTRGHGWLAWFTPLGLRSTVQPFTADRWPPLLVAMVTAALMAGAALVLDSRRDLGGSLLRVPTRPGRRLRVRTLGGLAWRLHRSTVLAWGVATAVGAAVFTAMGAGVIATARRGDLSGGFLEAQLSGRDPQVAYLGYIGAVIGIVVAIFALLVTLQAVAEEAHGAGEYLRTTGVTPAGVVGAHGFTALIGSGLVLGLAAAFTAVVGHQAIGGEGIAAEALEQVAGQWSSVLVLLGPAVLLAGWRPRLARLAWVPFGVSVGLALLGRLLGAPAWLIDIGAFDHAEGLGTPVVRVTAFACLAGLGLVAAGRRDLQLG